MDEVKKKKLIFSIFRGFIQSGGTEYQGEREELNRSIVPRSIKGRKPIYEEK